MLRPFAVPAIFTAALLTATAAASAQAPSPAPVERVAGGFGGFAPRGDGVRVVAPGALALASLDADHDGRLTDAEITAGAPLLFARADRNGDRQLTAFEQGDWAQGVGSPNDVLANPMLFDTDLDRVVTEVEFRAGLLRMASGLKASGASVVTFNDLVRPLNARQREESTEPTDGVDRIGGPSDGSSRR
jgi:hypothetical protein